MPKDKVTNNLLLPKNIKPTYIKVPIRKTHGITPS